jgi:hypothetical protein
MRTRFKEHHINKHLTATLWQAASGKRRPFCIIAVARAAFFGLFLLFLVPTSLALAGSVTPGQILVGDPTGAGYGPQTVNGDAALSSTGGLKITGTNGAPFATSATTDTTNANNISSGTLSAARLPNPSATTMGGVRSTAAQSHKWINAISTSGAPAQAQPASTDLSDLPIPTSSGGTGNSSLTANAPLFGNGASPIVNGTRSGNTTEVATVNGSTAGGDCAGWDANGNIVDNGSNCGGAGGSNLSNYSGNVTINATPQSNGSSRISNVNTAAWLDPTAFGASFSTATAGATAAASNATLSGMGSNDFVAPEGVSIAHGGAACSIDGTACSSITATAPKVELGTCVNIQQGSPYSAPNWQDDIGMFYARNMEPEQNNGSSIGQYSVSSGSYSFYGDYVPQTVCWALTVGHYPAGSHSIAVKVAALDAKGGMTAASSATAVSSAALAFPTATAPVLVYEGTPITGAAGYAFWESIDSGAYFLARVVWANEPWIDEGASATYAGAGFVEWGSYAIASEDIPSTPPGSALNDDLVADKIVSKSGNNITLTTAPGVSGVVTIKHDDASAWNDMLTYCSTLTNQSCQVKVKSGTTRLSSLVSVQSSVTKLTIIGQNEYTSQMQFFGNGGAKQCPATGTNPSNPTGGQFQDSSVLTLQDLYISSTNGAAECLIDVDSAYEVPLDIRNIRLNGGSYIHRGLVVGDVGGKIAGVWGDGFLQDIDLGTASNGMYLGGEYTSTVQIWPGELLYPQIGYLGGNANVTIDAWIFENGWNAIRPDGNASSVSGGYINGFQVSNPYISDMGDCNAADGCSSPLANYISGSNVTGQGTAVTLDATNALLQNTTLWGLPGQGCVWEQNYTAASNAVIKNVGCNDGAFGIIADSWLDAEDNRFAGLASNGIGIAASYPGSTIADNWVGGASGATGTIGYYLGYLHNYAGQGCNTGDPIYWRAGTGSQYTSGNAAIGTVLSACSGTAIEPGYASTTPSTTTLNGTGASITPAVNYKNTNQNISITASGTLTLNAPAYPNQTETVKICQSGGSGFVPTLAAAGGLTIKGLSSVSCTTGSGACCDFQVIFDTNTTGYVARWNGTL